MYQQIGNSVDMARIGDRELSFSDANSRPSGQLAMASRCFGHYARECSLKKKLVADRLPLNLANENEIIMLPLCGKGIRRSF